MRKLFCKTKQCHVWFLKNPFQYFPCEVLTCCFLISSLESWIHLLLNLDSSLCLFLNLEINLDLELVNSILKSFFWAFCHHQNYLNHQHEACFYIICQGASFYCLLSDANDIKFWQQNLPPSYSLSKSGLFKDVLDGIYFGHQLSSVTQHILPQMVSYPCQSTTFPF